MQEHFREVDERETFYGVKHRRSLTKFIFVVYYAIIQAEMLCLQEHFREVDERETFYGVKQGEARQKFIFVVFHALITYGFLRGL